MSKPNSIKKPGKGTGRKPVHLVAASGFCTPQDAIWQAVRVLKTFSHEELVMWLFNNGHEDVNDGTVKSYTTRLLRGGFLSVVKRETARNIVKRFTYQLANDVGIETPRLTKDGKPSKQGLGREQMWRTMKIIDDFTSSELAEAATTEAKSVAVSAAKDYIKHLYAAQYLQCISKSKPGTQARYRLVPSKNTGPRPPMVQKVKRIFDPNINQVVGEVVEELTV